MDLIWAKHEGIYFCVKNWTGSISLIRLKKFAVRRNVIAGYRQRQNFHAPFVSEAASHKVSLLCTDQWIGYHGLSNKGYPHATIDRVAKEYVVGTVHTNTMRVDHQARDRWRFPQR